MEYRRNFLPGGTFFFTVVTHRRRMLLKDQSAYVLLRQVMHEVKTEHPFEMLAWVIMHDHLHMIWKLPVGDTNYSTRWSRIKSQFSRRWIAQGGQVDPVSQSQGNKRQVGIWQSRFFEHTLRDEADLETHMDYIHYNPVKHGYVRRPSDWTRSSLSEYVRRGIYTSDWGSHPSMHVDLSLDVYKGYE